MHTHLQNLGSTERLRLWATIRAVDALAHELEMLPLRGAGVE
jgi:hypothetical protein